jgi:error-prone DNA polymerase
MGVYSAAQLINDARRHGVAVWPIDGRYSNWDHALEMPAGAGEPPAGAEQSAVRLGLRLVHGLQQKVAHRIIEARRQGPYKDIDDMAGRCELTSHELEALAAADALHGFEPRRHQAHWQVAGVEPVLPVFGRPRFNEAAPLLNNLSRTGEVIEDYRTAGVSLKAHPLALIRPHLDARRFSRAVDLHERRSGSLVRVAGLVTHRQRPGTATGVVFCTLEDETGLINLIVWPKTLDAQRDVFLHSNLLLVSGPLQYEDNVMHIVAGRIEDGTHLLGPVEQKSRDFK